MQYRLEDLAILTLQNLEEMSAEQMHTVLEHINNTRCAYLKGAFDFAQAFYDKEEKMPDEDYMTIHFENALYDTKIPFHAQLIADFVNYIKAESVSVLSQRAMQAGDFKSAITILQAMEKHSTQPVLKMKDVYKLWLENRKEFSFGLQTGIPELDDVYKFLGYKTLNVFAAPPANFKTTVACSMAFNGIYRQKLNVVYLTLEDTSEIINHNMLAAWAGEKGIKITAEEIKRYLLPDDKVPLLEELVSSWDTEIEGNFAVYSAREVDAFTPAAISKILDEQYKAWGNKLDVVIVDHFNIMNDPIPGLQLQGPQLAKYYVRYMTNLAISFGHKGFILVGLAQINREGQLKLEKGKELNGSELADTSELHRSATTVTSLFADGDDRATGMIRLKNVKNRLGPQGQMFMVPIFPERFKVGLEKSVAKVMTTEEFERLSVQYNATPNAEVDQIVTELIGTEQ